jgi:hypothetical protein
VKRRSEPKTTLFGEAILGKKYEIIFALGYRNEDIYKFVPKILREKPLSRA